MNCSVAGDCESGVCTGGVCQVPVCDDGVANGPETDKDCGGLCSPCADLKKCAAHADCMSGVCNAGICRVPTCADGVKNGAEPDVDCGGALCVSQGKRCATGQACGVGSDCQTGVCGGGVCLAASCGDGVTNGTDGCDDNNLVSGDGCSSSCTVEPGFVCAGAPSACATTCGDGVQAGAEGCDDGNVTSGDGCSGSCAAETGWACTGTAPTTCTSVCGDGKKVGAEGCDDGNVASGDGCSPTCAVESGWSCAGASPSTCSPICGDGVESGAEACDDGNVVSGDGCSSTCAVEAGFGCAGSAPTVCTAICGDGQKKGAEACDDGNTTAGDGCDATCAVESGFTCVGASPSVCTAVCGDGLKKATEACDDGNLVSGDGCSTGCNVEAGFSCAGAAPTVCNAICGDGLKRGAEACDDNNLVSGDGCSSTCAIESGFTCSGSPSACHAVCGDGQKKGAEGCDDGNTVSGDGCSFACVVESGWACPGAGPGSCTPICGDGQKKGAEVCDDANGNDGDGCSSTCAIEPGYTCNGSPSVCMTTCGDGVVAGNEDCDDGNMVDGDGCSQCFVDYGFTCAGFPTTTCTPICGDGYVAPGEPCDDGGTLDGDGCSSTCALETGYACQGSPSYCDPVCGDGIIAGYEQCDDGNTAWNDGCDDYCYIEYGFTCNGAPSVCTTPCGDGMRIGPEQCDDGNSVAGDCCSPTCTAEPGCEIESNDYPDVANAYQSLETNNVVKGIIAQYDYDYYKFTVPPGLTATLTASSLDGFLGTACTAYDSYMVLYDAFGTELDYDGFGPCGTLTVAGLPPGDYYLEIGANSWGQTFDYTLQMSATYVVCGDGVLDFGEQCDDGNTMEGDGCTSSCRFESQPELEPNDTCATANGPIAVPPAPEFALASGTINPETDQDWFSFTVPAYADLYIETFDSNGPGTCNNSVDTVIQLFRPNCAPVGPSVDQQGINNCSLIDGFYDTRYQHLPPGDYKVRVTAWQSYDIFDYTLFFGFAALCGDGVVEGSEQCDGTADCAADCALLPICGNGAKETGEQCDDGNATNGDGCNATCQWEKTPEVGVNDSPTDADTALPVILSNANITGSISPIGDVDTYKLHVTTPGVVRFEIFDQSGSDCIAIPAMTLTVLDSTGNFVNSDPPPDFYDEVWGGIGVCPALVLSLPVGDYYVQAQRKTVGTIPSYFLQIKYEASNGSEIEPNDDAPTATPSPGLDTFILGDMNDSDTDVYAVTIPPGPPRSLRIEVLEGDGLVTCESYDLDSYIDLRDSNGNYLEYDSDGGRASCSLIDGTGTVPSHPGAHNLQPGTYYIEVGNQWIVSYNYALAVTIR